MNKIAKRLIAAAMTVLMLAASVPVFASAASGRCDCEHVPMIYVYGRQATYDDPNSPDRQELNLLTDEKLSTLLKTVLPYASKAILTNNYDEYCEVLVSEFIKAIGDFGLDENGNLKNGSGIDYGWSAENPDTLIDSHKEDNVYSYVFLYDARLDPWEIADDFKVFIQAVKDVTGHDTVNIISRCMGSEYALAYFAKYGWSDIETFVQNCSSANGTDVMSELFAGKIKLDPDAIDRFMTEDVEAEPFTKALVSVLNQAKLLGAGTAVINRIYNKIRTRVVPEVMINEYATCPGYWTLVSSKDYEDAKKLIFSGREQTYAGLIEKIDNYNEKVRTKLPEILQSMHSDGVKLCTIVKYGFQLQPLTESYDLQSDDKISVQAQGFMNGGTAPQGETFSRRYIRQAKKDGTYKYISPDKVIDASKCLFPDTTWFMKDIRHNNFPGCVNRLYVAACRSEKELTVNDDERFPQYLRHYYWEDSLVPLNEENAKVFEYPSGFFKTFFTFVKLLIEKIKTSIKPA